MEAFCLIKAIFLIAFVAIPVRSTTLPTEDKVQPRTKSNLQACLDALRSRALGKPSGNQHNSRQATGDLHSPTTSGQPGHVDCTDIFDKYLRGSTSLLNRDQQELTAGGSSSKVPVNADASNAGAMESMHPETPEANSPQESPQPLSRRSRGITAEDQGLLLKANSLVSHLIEQLGVGASEEERARLADKGNPLGHGENGLLLTLARLRVLNKLKKALMVRTSMQGNSAGLPSTGILMNPSSSLTSRLGSIERDDGGEGNDLPFGASSSRQSDFPPDTGDAGVQSNGERLWSPTSKKQEEALEDSAVEKRSGYKSWYSRTRFLQKRHRNTLSINNAMMAITNMLLEDQKERLQRNRERIRQHMIIQG